MISNLLTGSWVRMIMTMLLEHSMMMLMRVRRTGWVTEAEMQTISWMIADPS